MGYKDASSKERFVILTNAALRLLQFVVALVTIGIYAVIKAKWLTDVPGRLTFDIAVGVIALIVSLIFGIIPFLFNYRLVAFGAVLDFIVAALYGVAYGLVKAIYDNTVNCAYDNKCNRHAIIHPPDADSKKAWADVNTFGRDSYVNIAGLILFVISGLMGIALIFIGRRSAGRGLKA